MNEITIKLTRQQTIECMYAFRGTFLGVASALLRVNCEPENAFIIADRATQQAMDSDRCPQYDTTNRNYRWREFEYFTELVYCTDSMENRNYVFKLAKLAASGLVDEFTFPADSFLVETLIKIIQQKQEEQCTDY